MKIIVTFLFVAFVFYVCADIGFNKTERHVYDHTGVNHE